MKFTLVNNSKQTYNLIFALAVIMIPNKNEKTLKTSPSICQNKKSFMIKKSSVNNNKIICSRKINRLLDPKASMGNNNNTPFLISLQTSY